MFVGLEQTKLENMLETAEYNLRALELFSSYLHICPRFVTAEDVKELKEACGVDVQTAVRLLVAAACGLNADESEADRVLEEDYFRHAIHLLDVNECRNDPYYQTIRMPETTRGTWKMGYRTIKAYELFTSDDLKVLGDGREIPQTGFFTEDFRAPIVEENGREWMTVTPSEINTMTADIHAVSGKVAVFGLGLGYYAFMASQKPDVTQVVVIERDKSVISLFREFILPQFPNKEKITVLEADAYVYAEKMGEEHFDWAYVDIWHDVLDGVEMYLKMKRLEKHSPDTQFLYWIEPSMLAWLRGMALMEVAEKTVGPMLKTIGTPQTADELAQLLSDENLRRVAKNIPLEVTKRA